VALVRGLDEGLLRDLWNFPAAFGKSREEARTRLGEKLREMALSEIVLGEPVAGFRHGITFRSICVHVYPVNMTGSRSTDGVRWFRAASVESAAVSQLARKVAAALARERQGQLASHLLRKVEP
jgi:hypothetical protein